MPDADVGERIREFFDRAREDSISRARRPIKPFKLTELIERVLEEEFKKFYPEGSFQVKAVPFVCSNTIDIHVRFCGAEALNRVEGGVEINHLPEAAVGYTLTNSDMKNIASALMTDNVEWCASDPDLSHAIMRQDNRIDILCSYIQRWIAQVILSYAANYRVPEEKQIG